MVARARKWGGKGGDNGYKKEWQSDPCHELSGIFTVVVIEISTCNVTA